MTRSDATLYIPRAVEEKLYNSLAKNVVTMVAGARQVGKSTLMRHVTDWVMAKMLKSKTSEGEFVISKRVFQYNLDDINLRAALKKDVSFIEKDINLALGEPLTRVRKKVFVFIDEIQKFPMLLDWIKQVYDVNGKNVKFLITGSSVTNFKDKMVETLAGRIEYIHLYPINFGELVSFKKGANLMWLKDLLLSLRGNESSHEGTDILDELEGRNAPTTDGLKKQVEEYLQKMYIHIREDKREVIGIFWESLFYGGLPRIFQVPLNERIEVIRNYVSIYLEREIGFISRNLDLELFGLSLGAFAEQSGMLLNIQKVSKDVGVARPSLYRYLDLLENTFLIKRVYPYVRGTGKEATKSVVLYYIDPGLVNVLSHVDSVAALANDNKAKSRAVASVLVNQFLTAFEFFDNPPRLFYWADYDNHRVDFVFDWYGITFGTVVTPYADVRKFDTTLEKFVKHTRNKNVVIFVPKLQFPNDQLEYSTKIVRFNDKQVLLVSLPYSMLC